VLIFPIPSSTATDAPIRKKQPIVEGAISCAAYTTTNPPNIAVSVIVLAIDVESLGSLYTLRYG
jgi:hypothetical protein